MQLLSLGQLLGAVAVQPVSPSMMELIQRPEMQRIVIIGIVLLLICQVAQIFSCWGASRLLGRKETASLKNAVNVWISTVLFTVGVYLAVIFVTPFVAEVRDPWRIASTYCGLTLLSIVIFFLIPMKIYAIDFWRAFGIFLLTVAMEGLVLMILVFATSAIFISAQDRVALQKLEQAGKVLTDQWEMALDGLAGKNPTAEINRLLDEATTNPRPPLRKREANVRALQRRLDRQRRILPAEDQDAAAVFRGQIDRYMRLLQEVKAERANSSANRSVHHFPAENFTSLVT